LTIFFETGKPLFLFDDLLFGFGSSLPLSLFDDLLFGSDSSSSSFSTI